MDKVDRLIEGWISEGLLPGAVIDIAICNRFRFSKAYGTYSDGIKRTEVQLDTLFDIASLTKVTATLPAVLLLADAGKLKLDHPAQEYLREFCQPQVTLRHLLQHAAGLPADLPVVPRHAQRPGLLGEIFGAQLDFPPGESTRYSDLGMILLGLVVERVAGERLDRFVSRTIFEPLGMRDTMYTPPQELRHRIAATEWVDEAYVHGEVHDEKSFHLGGVSGSAGLFSTASDLTRYASWWLQAERHPLLSSSQRTEAVGSPVRGRGLGWEVLQETPFSPSAGKSWPLGSYGHTGFTGTSLWIEPERGLSVVFLTNAVHLGRGNRIREFRPILHDTVLSLCSS
ncbi:serine hydrolase domain-containing protein [Paenibacillus cremeus]|uniref:Beta-lactamase family protein n=1 Tax=Paenibacillus cremeus TaxID=2163881 RepID=A0A559KDJ3_9BACL|nr:serine hydrolase domain-containing protein [Paenibacillus cremeus]TVY10185.1 beta-lactamase family protein [Paenibacillus cremeus]